MSRPSSFESERDNGHATASEANDHAACTPRSQAAILHAATEATFSFKASTSSAQPPASLPPVKKDPGSSAKKINDARREDGGGGGMDVLLSMPANELRPVTFADFERALAIIMPADFEGLTQKYEEWNSQYGSGADSKRGGGAGRGRHYSTMYV